MSARLGDASNTVWTTTDINGYIDNALRGLYPTFFQRNVNTTTAGSGPLQTMPSTARNVYSVGLQATGATRVRPLRNWVEGFGNALIPKLNITGETLVWAWTSGWDAPANDTDALTIPLEAQEVVILRVQIAALEHILGSRAKQDKYFSLQVRQAVDENDLATMIDALHASLTERLSKAQPLPEVKA